MQVVVLLMVLFIISIVTFSLEEPYWYIALICFPLAVMILVMMLMWKASSFVIDNVESLFSDTKVEIDYDFKKE